jgi:hypothetical protein
VNQCEHGEYDCMGQVYRLTAKEVKSLPLLEQSSRGEAENHILEVQLKCKRCGVRFQFLGLPVGVNLNGAAVSFDRTEVRLAISPKGART